jgi:hypothetical protein
MNIAAHFLQNILRGRLIQIQIHEEKERNLDLISELKAKHALHNIAKTDPSALPNTIVLFLLINRGMKIS